MAEDKWRVEESFETVLYPGNPVCEHVFIRLSGNSYNLDTGRHYLGIQDEDIFFCPKCLCQKMITKMWQNPGGG